MSILEDEREQIKQNREYLKGFISDFLKKELTLLHAKYDKAIENDVLEPLDKDEVSQFLNSKFKKLQEDKGSYFILSIHDNRAILNASEFYASSLVKSLLDMAFPSLGKRLNMGTLPKEYILLKNEMRNSLELAYLKQRYRETKQTTVTVEVNAVEAFKPNLSVFKNIHSHKFFIYLYEDWLSEITNCRPQLSYVIKALKDNKESPARNDYAIICTKKYFAEYWNSLSHPFKIKIDKGAKVRLSNVDTSLYETEFNQRRDYFYSNQE